VKGHERRLHYAHMHATREGGSKLMREGLSFALSGFVSGGDTDRLAFGCLRVKQSNDGFVTAQ